MRGCATAANGTAGITADAAIAAEKRRTDRPSMSNPFANWRIEDVDRQNAKAAGRSLVSPQSTSKAVERERDLHDDIEALCKYRGYLYRHDRMDRPTTGQVGWPDWTIFMPGTRVVFLECKARKSKATIEQLSKLAHARKFGFAAEVVDNYSDALAVIERANGTGTGWNEPQ